MAVKAPPLVLAWGSVFFLSVAWFLLLGGVGSLQSACGDSGATSLLRAGSAGYLAPVTCNRFYSYVWWTVWYDFFAIILVAYLLATSRIHTLRYGAIGFLIPVTYLLMSTSDVAQALWHIGVSPSRAKVLLAGGIISSIFQVVLIVLLGIHDELAVK
uniref:Uncharacterized protein n=1 Tax=Auxenochlorella protothecoides TaxID=3075 RepID=A0A1D1ZXF4_AUXPR